MLYRAVDCGVYERSAEPLTVAWIRGFSPQDASAKLSAALAATWGVEPSEVFFSNLYSEIDLERNSVQDITAGNRRWIEWGCVGSIPYYDDFKHTLIFLDARDRARLMQAWFDARQHSVSCATLLDQLAEQCRAKGDMHGADNFNFDAQKHRELASAVAPTVIGSDQHMAASHSRVTRERAVDDIRRAKDLMEAAAFERENKRHKVAGDYSKRALDLLTSVTERGALVA